MWAMIRDRSERNVQLTARSNLRKQPATWETQTNWGDVGNCKNGNERNMY